MKVCLPLSLLFACAAAPVAAFAGDATVDSTVLPDTVFSDPLIKKQWQWYTAKNGVDIASLWASGITGTGVVIGILDNWVEPNHEDLNISPYNPGTDLSNGLSKDFVGTETIPTDDPETEEDESQTQIYTDEDHGTFVAGMAAATGGNGTGVVGAAPGATIAGLHVGDAEGAYPSYIVSAMYWASGVSSTGVWTGEAEIAVKNCSWGSSFGVRSEVTTAMEQTTQNGTIYVFAAGNDRQTSSGSPGSTGWSTYGNSTAAINVAATNSDGTYADFSSYGSNVFISAPGAAVVSTDRTGTLGYNDTTSLSSSSSSTTTSSTTIRDNNYASSDGTSFASPLVAGVIALGKQVCTVMDTRWAKHALAYSSGYGDAPNIDCVWDSDAGTYVQSSGYTTTETSTDDDGNTVTTTTTVASTGDWSRNNGGYWFNNNYGFGLVDPVGFVDKVINIAYTTIETTADFSSSDISLKDSAVDSSTDERTAVYSFSTLKSQTNQGNSTLVQQLTQKLETVSVTIDFSAEIDPDAGEDEIDVKINLNSLKVTLIAPDGQESVLVQPSGDPDNVQYWVDSDVMGTTWTFETNAFWGSDYSSSSGEWQVKIEYEGSEGNTQLLSVDSVNFTMGTYVDESSNLRVSREVNAHALALDKSDSNFTVANGGKFLVEEGVLINGGKFTVAYGGEVGFYADNALSGKTGAIFIQTGGETSISGTATFDRGFYVTGGTATIAGGTLDPGDSGAVVTGGSLTISSRANSVVNTVSSFNISLYGGSVSLTDSVSFMGQITQYGGVFTAGESVKGYALSMLGGTATLNSKSSFSGQLSVGGTEDVKDSETGEVTETIYYGGTLNISGSKVSASLGVAVSGAGVAIVSSGTELNLMRDASKGQTSGVSVRNSGYFELGENASVVGTLSVSGGSASLKGGNSLYGISVTGGTLSVAGTLKTDDLSVSGGTFRAVGTTTLLARDSTYADGLNGSDTSETAPEDLYPKMTVSDGSTLAFSARSRTDRDVLVIGEGQKLVFEAGATVNFSYSFGDVLPFETSVIEITPEYEKDDDENYVLGDDGERIAVTKVFGLSDISIPEYTVSGVQVYDDDLKLNPLTLSAKYDSALGRVSMISGLGDGISVISLHYDYQTQLQNAVQLALLKNEDASAPFAGELENMNYVSEVLTAYDKVGAPANMIAIDELHDKQANAITGALSRRSRELRSGFVHMDVWSNPLFGKSGFSFSVNPNLVAAKGFVPYATAEDDFPLMIWMNGGYSFSEADDGAMSVSSTKSSMFNFVMGADYGVSDDFALGVFAGYTSGRTKFDDGGRTEIQSRNVGVYLAGSRSDKVGSLYYTAMASLGYEEYDFSRKISVGSLNASAKASPDGWQGIVFLEGGYEWKMEKFSMGPALSLRYVMNNIDSYTESSDSAWMRQDVDDVSYDSLQSSVGWRISYRADFETVSLLPEVRLSWNHEFLGRDEDFDVRLALPGADSYTCSIANTGDDYATFGAGLTVMLGEVTTLSFDYDVQFLRDDADPTHSFNAMLRVRF